jgi:bifunctional DNA-binding transcriptional regulator/antitoxin component of YhaV-PrlF toxin-antitoxin module
MGNLRTLGVRGKNLPTKKARTVEPSDFSIGGIIGQFERKYDQAFLVNNPTEFQEIFGFNINSSYYGSDVVNGFFQNIVGQDGKLYVKSHVGYDGSAIDAVVATVQVNDQQGSPGKILQIDAAYEQTLEYGISGNRTGYTITNGNRFTTAVATASIASATSIVLDSVAGIKIGDIVEIIMTGASGITEYRKVTNVIEATNTIEWSGGATGASQIDDVVNVLGFQLKTWRKDINGIVREVDTELGKVWCTTESEVSDYYVENVFSTSKWIYVTRLTTTPASIEDTFPANVSTVSYLASGVDGTSPTTAAHWSRDLTKLNTLPVRFIANPETSDITIQKAMETYCKGRFDNPKVIFNIASDQTKSQLITIGNNYQRSDDVLGVISADRLKITDPFATSTLAPDRVIPNVGHCMGVIIRTIGEKGIHYIPQKDTPILGINGLDNDNIIDIDDNDRTDLAEAGINVIQFIQGSGYVIRNSFTPSITEEFMFLNGLNMREYIKISSVDSLQSAENQPNSFNRIKENRTAILSFLYDLWNRGSNGNVPEGETFGQSFDDEGNPTPPEDHFEVQADLINNPQSKINIGEQNIYTFFTFPAPAGSIEIGVGYILR